MGQTNAQRLDVSSPVARRFNLGTHLQALEDLSNLMLAFGHLPKLLAQLDADDATTSDYAATLAALTPGDVVAKFNLLLAKLDTDAKPAGADYAATLTAASASDLPRVWPLLLTKLDGDDNADNTYVAKNTLPFLTTINEERSF